MPTIKITPEPKQIPEKKINLYTYAWPIPDRNPFSVDSMNSKPAYATNQSSDEKVKITKGKVM